MPRGGKRSTSFKPGQSGNPQGRPRKGTSIAEVCRELLEARIRIPNTKSRRIASRAIVSKAIEQALFGDPHARAWLADRAEGKPVQQVDAETRVVIEHGEDPYTLAPASSLAGARSSVLADLSRCSSALDSDGAPSGEN